MCAANERDQLATRWDVPNPELERLAAAHAHAPEGEDASPQERALLKELDWYRAAAGRPPAVRPVM